MAKKFPVKNTGTEPSTGRPEAQFQQFGYENNAFDDAQAEALRIVKFEKTNWETAFAYITEKVAYNMRDVIRQCRKNYWGVFDQPTDPTTGREKIWEHLTKTFVDYVVTAYNLDSKDVNFRAKHPDAIALTAVVRSIVKNKMEEMGFGEELKKALRQLAIDGTIVWRTDLVNNKPLITLVDLLNFYIDPTVDSIADADSVIERIVLPIDKFQEEARKGNWINQDIQGRKQVSRYDTIQNPGYNTNSDITFVELYRRRGLAKKLILTGNSNDLELVPMEIICSGTYGSWLFHYAESRPDNRDKGYDEAWLTRVHGRWYGEGVAERLLQKQTHINIISNIKVNRAYTSQLGLFLVRKGSGITPQMLGRLAANGAISVTNVETDIKQFPMDENLEASNAEIESIFQWAQRYTGAEDVVTGEQLPASTPATNAAIQNQNAKSRFTLIRDGVGMFLTRFFKGQALPLMLKTVTKGELVRMHLPQQDLDDIDKHYLVNPELLKKLKAIHEQGQFVDPEQVMEEQQRAIAKLRAGVPERFVKLLHDIDVSKYDVAIDVTNESFDKATMFINIQNLLQTLVAIPGVDPQSITNLIREEVDLMGLDSGLIQFNPQLAAQQMGMQQPGQPQQQGQPGQPQGQGQNTQSTQNAATKQTPNGIVPKQTRPSQLQGGNLAAIGRTMEPH